MKTSKKWGIGFIFGFLLILAAVGIFVMIVDPCFHYHKPIDGMEYTLENERYQNNGIAKHFEYDAVIAGSSMTECFRPSQMNDIFGVNAVKMPFSGGSFKEVNEILEVATEHNPDIKMVVRCLDAIRFFDDKDQMDYSDYPEYLYDDNLINDVNYLFNKEWILMALQNVLFSLSESEEGDNFDEYANWDKDHSFGINTILYNYNWRGFEVPEKQQQMTEEDYERLRGNIEQNVIALAKENPQIEFYLYISPYSVYCMDCWWRTGELEKRLQAERYVIELLLPYENIHINSFNTEYEVIGDANNYRDLAHHREEVNTQILYWLAEGEHELTYENYEDYCNEMWSHYTNFDFNSLYE